MPREPEGGGCANFAVAVRCRHLDAREEAAAALRFARRGDMRHHCVLLNRTAPSPLAPAVTGGPPRRRGEPPASVVLVDPDAGGDLTSLWRGSAATAGGPSLLLQLGAEELQRALVGQDGVFCFSFDEVFPPAVTNEEIYAALVQPLVIAAEDGYNGTVLAYGQTGTGKSHTVFGERGDGVPGLCTLVAADLFGQRSRPAWCHDTCVPVRGVGGRTRQGRETGRMIFVSFLELYNERLRDLLVDPATATPASSVPGQEEGEGWRGRRPLSSRHDDLEVVEHPVHGVQVPHATSIRVRSVEELERLLELGERRRTKAPTAHNKVSSRSHAIVQFTVRRCMGAAMDGGDAGCARRVVTDHRTEAQTLCSFLTAKLWMVDLAGSERVSGLEGLTTAGPAGGGVAHAIGGVPHPRESRRREGANINRSLLALGNCIKALGRACRRRQQQQHPYTASGDPVLWTSHSVRQCVPHMRSKTVPLEAHVPYRDSKLTRLLKESLGGNTRTVMLATISPSCGSFEETLSTLRYASRARRITRHVRQNVLVGAAADEDEGDEDKEEEEDEEGKEREEMPTTARGCGRRASPDGNRTWASERESTHRLRLLELEAEVRSLQTQLRVAQAAAEKMGLPRHVGDVEDIAPAVSTTTSSDVTDGDAGKRMNLDHCWEIYNQTRCELQALLRERATASARQGNDSGGHRALGSKGPIRELLRQERKNALLQERQRRIDAFLL